MAESKETLEAMLARAETAPRALDAASLAALLALPTGSSQEEALFAAAKRVRERYTGSGISIRGLIEAGNLCVKDCLYCGIRRSNSNVERYSLDAEEILRLAKLAKSYGYASVVLQSGEIESEAHTAFIEDVLQRMAPLDLGVTLSLGEQSEETYARWRKAGAARYLLRIESSNPALYAAIHPKGHSWQRRRDCLAALARLGYQVGTGIMTGLPGQTALDLANDIFFYDEIDADMIGMGPWIPHPDAPLAETGTPTPPDERLSLALRMIAATRLHLHNINIAAATALQALADDGRERGVLAGANVIMPNITDVKYRKAYQLYKGKPCLNEDSSACRHCLDRRLASIGTTILYGQRGDSLHYAAKSSRNQ